MIKKIIGLIICTLLITTAVSPVFGNVKILKFTGLEIDSFIENTMSLQSELENRESINFWTNMYAKVVEYLTGRWEFGMAYDSNNEHTILFGGLRGSLRFNDTWLYNYNNDTWYNAKPSIQGGTLNRRCHIALAYDSLNDHTLLFGGCFSPAQGDELRDTWLYDFSDNTWYNMSPSFVGGILTKRSGYAMTYDSDAERVILYGGWGGATGFLNDTWEYNYDDNTWTKLSTVEIGGSLPTVVVSSLAYDSHNKVAVLFGGDSGGSNDVINETWVFYYSNKTWVKKNPSIVGGTLEPRRFHSITYDSEAQHIILFGGQDDTSQYLSDTWIYNVSNNTWNKINYQTAGGNLKPRAGQEIVYDSSACKIVLFGGITDNKLENLNDTWVFSYNVENNQVPDTPNKPNGPYILNVDELGTYSTSTNDSDGDHIQFKFDWDANGNHDYSSWTNFVPSGTEKALSHFWSEGGDYVVKAQARDLYGEVSEWSAGLSVFVNNPPSSPSDPNPPDNAIDVDINATLSWNCSDPEGENLTYDVFFEANDPTPDEIVSIQQSETWYDPETMDYDTDYYWQIIAFDNYEAFTFGPIWHFKTESEYTPESDLDCYGQILLTNVKPGSNVNSNFTVKNIGDTDSKLDWEVVGWPGWGNWTFDPHSGDDLQKDEETNVQVTIVAPDEPNKEFTGEVKVVNKEDTSDYEIIPVSITTPRNKPCIFNFYLLSWFLERFPMLERLLSFLLL